MNKVTILALVLVLAGCSRVSVREAANTVAEAPTVTGAIASLVLRVMENGSPPTYDEIGDAIVDCVDDYQDTLPATSDLMMRHGHELDCVCWFDWEKRISFERPGYSPNPRYRASFCPAPEPEVVTQALPPPSPIMAAPEPQIDPECVAEYGEDHWYCQPVQPEWVK